MVGLCLVSCAKPKTSIQTAQGDQITQEVKVKLEPVFNKQKRISDKGIYITYYMSRTPRYFNKIKEQAKKCGINTLVIDAKMMLSQPLLPLIKEKKLNANTKVEPNPWLLELTKQLHTEGFIVTARLVVFKDDHLVIARPDLGIKLPGGELYRDRKGGRWSDPYSEEVRLFNELVAESAAISGVDEIQFDYIRFPAEGKAKTAVYAQHKEGLTKVDALCLFLEGVKKRVAKYNTSIAFDIFGVTAWQSKYDIENLGQDLKRIAKYIDVLCPMLYPSHFHNGYDGYANPGAEPYYFVHSGVKRTQELLSQESVSIVPWIQGFNMRSPNFGPAYIQAQVKAAKDAGVTRFLIWNASNKYDTSFNALK